jgi:hypothetical protein
LTALWWRGRYLFDARVDGGVDDILGTMDIGFTASKGYTRSRHLFGGCGMHHHIDALHGPTRQYPDIADQKRKRWRL